MLFIVGLGAFAYHVVANKEHAHRIHYLMIALGAFKVLTLLSQFGMYHYIRVTGEPDGWNVAYYIFTFFRSVFLFTVIILIGTGWSYMTPFLGEKERRVLVIVLPLQVSPSSAVAAQLPGRHVRRLHAIVESCSALHRIVILYAILTSSFERAVWEAQLRPRGKHTSCRVWGAV